MFLFIFSNETNTAFLLYSLNSKQNSVESKNSNWTLWVNPIIQKVKIEIYLDRFYQVLEVI